MKGKIGLIVGLGAGYVLGARAGRERYEQIKRQWLKFWHLDPVQQQVQKLKSFASAQAMAVPAAVWTGAVKIAKSAAQSGTPGQKLDAVIDTGKDAAKDVADAAESVIEESAAAEKKKSD